ncbi:MAG: hypothetical protein ABJH07_03455 [Sedimentitalea sp.]|uniref:hypothetical protein n=1 Tax=Sedimentitalea sp. TaxID=2048915 RepID=UPI00326591DB
MINLLRSIPVLLLLAACAMPDNPTQSGNGGTEIQLETGRNCWANRCFSYDSARQMVSLPGKNPARVPGAVNTQKGFVTETEFAAMFNAAAMSYANGVGRR